MQLSRNRTTLIVAHRLATIRHADRIVVLTPNGISEHGSHDDLMALQENITSFIWHSSVKAR